MTAGKKLAYTVTVYDEQNEKHTYGPDDTVPAWAAKAITNPSAWGDDDGSATPADVDEDETEEVESYEALSVKELKAEVDTRNAERDDARQIVVGGKGNKSDLIAALEADDAASE